MTSVRKRKMNRSSVKKNTRRTKDKQRDINIHSNPIIAANWDKSLTLQQNYKRLGLRAKLGHLAGGQEQKVEKLSEIKLKKQQKEAEQVKISDIEQTTNPEEIPEGEARLIRDPETNEVTQVIYGTMKVVRKPEVESTTSVVQQLEEYARKNSEIVRERKQSDRENDWCRSLFEKYGDDYEKMKWDKKLNIYQQSAGDLRRRIMKWKKSTSA
ncbi:nucleolar protein 16 [[Candida] anglica]|uniref:Nucleolar protein 16 n=1 Tax=[Candida] anglica TaxID=148631 RepID=A0ABP0EFH9_9ASCO